MNNPNQFTDEQLLKMAMGVKLEDEEAQKSVDFMKLKAEWEVIPERKKDQLTKRRKMRHNMFKIVKRLTRKLEMTPELDAIKAIIDSQLDNKSPMKNWYAFTFHWDIHPSDHTKVITKAEWFREGGSYDELGALRPPAFTEQEIS
jgi:hypothetical protein